MYEEYKERAREFYDDVVLIYLRKIKELLKWFFKYLIMIF